MNYGYMICGKIPLLYTFSNCVPYICTSFNHKNSHYDNHTYTLMEGTWPALFFFFFACSAWKCYVKCYTIRKKGNRKHETLQDSEVVILETGSGGGAFACIYIVNFITSVVDQMKAIFVFASGIPYTNNKEDDYTVPFLSWLRK